MQPVQGIHHITAIAGDPQRNLDFYHHLLGQRLVKRTVNFDDPGTYHFYFGDEIGTPGTILTFFPWQHMVRGRRGNGEVAATAYTIASSSIDFWRRRLAEHNVQVSIGHSGEGSEPRTRFGQEVLSFEDPDGMVVELVASESRGGLPGVEYWKGGPIPAEHALRGFHSATLWVAEAAPTADLLVSQLGYTVVGKESEPDVEVYGGRASHPGEGPSLVRLRLQAGGEGHGRFLDLLERPGLPFGKMGAGTVHHIAFRTVDDGEQQEYLQALREARYAVSPVKDRQYFHSIYFRAPSGVLFEIATDAPGFLADESPAELGANLKLPAWLEPQRKAIEAILPPVTLAAPETHRVRAEQPAEGARLVSNV
jgi:glyoxalase family protein